MDQPKILFVSGGYKPHTGPLTSLYIGHRQEQNGAIVEYADSLDVLANLKPGDFDVINLNWTMADSPVILERVRQGVKKANAIIGATRDLTDEQRRILAEYEDLVLEHSQGDCGRFTPEAMDGLLNAVDSGDGYLSLHGGGGDTSHGFLRYLRMIRVTWGDHFGGNIDSYRVVMKDKKHQITKGVPNFDMTGIRRIDEFGNDIGGMTEQYCWFEHPAVTTLAYTRHTGKYDEDGRPSMKGKRSLVLGTNQSGQGAVAIFSFGHSVGDLNNPIVRQPMQLVENGIEWLLTKPYKK